MPIRDTRMTERALRQRWPITPEYRAALVKRLMAIALSRESCNREATAAARALLAADQINAAAERDAPTTDVHVHMHADYQARLEGLVERLEAMDDEIPADDADDLAEAGLE